MKPTQKPVSREKLEKAFAFDVEFKASGFKTEGVTTARSRERQRLLAEKGN